MRRRSGRPGEKALAIATAAFVSMPAVAMAFPGNGNIHPADNGLRLAPGIRLSPGLRMVLEDDNGGLAPGLRLLGRYVSPQVG